MAHDSTSQRILLFGGWSGGAWQSDTWTWDGVDWTRRNPAVAPPALGSPALAGDPTRGRLALIGQRAGGVETWEWDGTAWSRRLPALSPPPAETLRLAFDAARRRQRTQAQDQVAECHASFMTRPMAVDMRSHSLASTASCRRPAGVSR